MDVDIKSSQHESAFNRSAFGGGLGGIPEENKQYDVVVVNSMFLAKKPAKNWILFRHEEAGLLNFVRSTAASIPIRPGIHP